MKQLIDGNERLAEERLELKRAKQTRRENRGAAQHAIDVIKYVSWLPGFVYEIQALRNRAEDYSGYRDFTEDQLRNVLGSVTRIVEQANSRDIQVSLVVFPYPPDYLLATADNRLTPRLDQWARTLGVGLFDLLPVFKGQPAMTHACDTHWSATGNKFAAQAIAKWLSRE